MPQAQTVSVENNFTKGLITESTGLNFPENAATAADNCEFTLVGDTLRREGIDVETNGIFQSVNRAVQAVSRYKWNNAGGDGLTQVVVKQIGSTLYFYKSSVATLAAPLSTTVLASTVNISSFVASGGTFDTTLACEYSDGNGYLFVYHPSCDPFYCTYAAGVITGNLITVQIRDFVGIPETGVNDNTRPLTLTNEHKYNLINQGWISGNPWTATSTTSVSFGTGAKTFTVATGISGVVGGQSITVTVPGTTSYMVGTVTSYTSGTGSLVLSITSFNLAFGTPNPNSNWVLTPSDSGRINTWFTAVGNYPSNADVWWNFKNTLDVFDPATTLANTTIGTGPAPKGSIILTAFQQQRSSLSGVPSLTDITTLVRPRTGTWFQGRVWFTGVDSTVSATGDEPFTTWTESIYFSQIIQSSTQFGKCYQENDPTSQTLFDLLPTDGGVIVIQGSGSVYKLFPVQNGLLVFAANGIWFITGSQGIGFSATDYTITKISSVQSISSTSFVNVMGLPYFWNEEGIYTVQPSQQGGLTVEPLTVGTILNFYNAIPLSSKKYVQGDYHPIDYVIQWVYKDTEATSVTDRYSFNKILNFNTFNKAFFPYTVDNTTTSINGVLYVAGPGGLNTTQPSFKYLVSTASGNNSFGDEHVSTYVDWASTTPVNFVSTFTTGYKLRGQAIRKFQPMYIQMYSRVSGAAFSYKIQGIWDYSNSRSSGRWSQLEQVNYNLTRYDTVSRRHKIRGRGFALQFRIVSTDGMPFDIQGWAIVDNVNQGV